jgi:hypothetical protein
MCPQKHSNFSLLVYTKKQRYFCFKEGDKMKNYRLFLLGFITVSFVLLSGFTKPGVKHASPAKKTAASVQSKKDYSKVKQSPVSSTQKKAKNQRLLLSDKNTAIEAVEPQKPLDLSIPFKDDWLKTEQNRIAQTQTQTEATNMFAVEKKKKLRSVDLDGQMLMSQEPEADKRKSLDGAAIVINLKR